MAQLELHSVSLAIGDRQLLDSAELVVAEGERVALLGRNGAGKSTLMKVISGHVKLDSGVVRTAPGVNVAYLEQSVPREWTGTVLQQAVAGLGDVGPLLAEFDRVAKNLGRDEDAARLSELQEQLDRLEGWEQRRAIDDLLSLLELDPDADVRTLSGGQSRRVLLASALASGPDVLLLDEPTNHLDIESIELIEGILTKRVPTLVFVSHDRAFVQRLATRIVELDRGSLHSYPGDYAKWVENREERLRVEAKAAAHFDKVLAEEEAWIRQGIKARRTRNEGRVRRLKKLRMERASRVNRQGEAKLKIQEADRSGRIVVRASNINYSWEGSDHDIVSNFSTVVSRADRIGIIGPNGAGKTTLVRLLLGELEPRSGEVELGTRLQVAYFDQHREQLDPEMKVWEAVADGNDQIDVNGRRTHVMSWLKNFLFPSDRARGPIKVLSGGERNRLLLARLFATPANTLVLDEPTNDLDIETLELLEEQIAEFSGTVLVISHDRAFLNSVVTSTIAAEGDGQFSEYAGGYDDYLRQRPAPEDDEPTDDKTAAAVASGSPREPSAQKAEAPRRRKLTNKERQALVDLPKRIAALETEEAEIHERLANPAVYRDAPDEVGTLNERLSAIATEQEAAFERWAELEELASG